MSLWLDALKAAGRGHSDRARELLNELIITLRYPKQGRSKDDCAYDGPVANAVLHAINGFVDKEDRQLAQNNAEELIDYVVGLIGKKIERTIELIEYCLTYPEKGLEAVRDDFEGLRALKRKPEDLQEFIRLRLQSMIVAGVEFAVESLAVSQATVSEVENAKLLGFDERNFIKSLKINEKWIDFRQRERLTYKHESYDLLYDNIAAETSDFGEISDKFASFSVGRDLEFAELTEQIAKKLNEILNEMHSGKPSLGFGPIAWHRVWWTYDVDGYLGLECVTPECVTDETLAEHISGTYLEVQNMNRLIAHRRRTKLEDTCKESVTELYQSYARIS
jgi:hypothetical protein